MSICWPPGLARGAPLQDGRGGHRYGKDIRDSPIRVSGLGSGSPVLDIRPDMPVNDENMPRDAHRAVLTKTE